MRRNAFELERFNFIQKIKTKAGVTGLTLRFREHDDRLDMEIWHCPPLAFKRNAWLTAIENTRASVLETGNSADSIANASRDSLTASRSALLCVITSLPIIPSDRRWRTRLWSSMGPVTIQLNPWLVNKLLGRLRGRLVHRVRLCENPRIRYNVRIVALSELCHYNAATRLWTDSL